MQAARFVAKKGVDLSIRAFAEARPHLGPSELRLFGEGPDRGALVALAQALGVGDSVRFMGLIPPAAYAGELASAHIGIQPSRVASNGDTEGGAPTVLLEFQAAGVPVVATRHADIPAVVASADEFVAENDAAGLADALVRSPSYRRTSGGARGAGAGLRRDPPRGSGRRCTARRCLPRGGGPDAVTKPRDDVAIAAVRTVPESQGPDLGGLRLRDLLPLREWAEIWRDYSGGRIRPAPRMIEFSDGTSALLPLSLETAYRGLGRAYLSSPAGTFGGWISKHTLTTTHAAFRSLATSAGPGPLAVESLRSHCPRPPPSGCALRHDANAAADRRLRLGDGFDALRGPDGMAKGERAGVREDGRVRRGLEGVLRGVPVEPRKVGAARRRATPGCSSPRCTAASRRESASGSRRAREVVVADPVPVLGLARDNWHGAALATSSACAP